MIQSRNQQNSHQFALSQQHRRFILSQNEKPSIEHEIHRTTSCNSCMCFFVYCNHTKIIRIEARKQNQLSSTIRDGAHVNFYTPHTPSSQTTVCVCCRVYYKFSVQTIVFTTILFFSCCFYIHSSHFATRISVVLVSVLGRARANWKSAKIKTNKRA